MWWIVSTSPTSKLEEHPLSTAGEWFFNILGISFRRYNARRNIQRKYQFLPKFNRYHWKNLQNLTPCSLANNFRKFGGNVLDGYCCTLPRNAGRTAGALDGFIYIQEIVICFWRPWGPQSWTTKLSLVKWLLLKCLAARCVTNVRRSPSGDYNF